MSNFDKYVAELMSRMGDSVAKEQREKVLKNINASLDDYQQLQDPAAAQARRDAEAAKKTQAEAQKAEAEAKKAREEEQRRRMERQAKLPPLSPFVKKPPTEMDAVAQKNPATVKAADGSKRGMTPRTPPPPPASTQQGKRKTAPAVQVRGVDFKFANKVGAQLRALETEKASSNGNGSRATTPPPPPVADNSEPTTGKPAIATVSPATARVASAPAARSTPASRPAPSTKTPPASKATPRMKSGTKVFAAPPAAKLAPAPLAARTSVDSEDPVMKHTKSPSTTSPSQRLAPPPLLNCDELNEPSEMGKSPNASLKETLPIAHADTFSYQDTFKGFTFGRASLGSNHSSDVDSDAEEEEEFIDDHEDIRRRTVQMQRPSRGGISDSTLDINEARIASFPTTPKSKDKVKTISRVLVRHFLFSTLDDSDVAKFASIMDIERFEAGTHVLEKGAANDTLFIVLDGDAVTTREDEAGVEVEVPLVRGSTFGDLALMYEVNNEAAVVARTALQCASLERRTYKLITSRAMEEKRRRYLEFLASIPVFAGLSSYELECVAELLKDDSYVEGQKVLAAGVPNHWLHIIMEGSMDVLAPDTATGEMKKVATLHRGDFAGHIEFIYRHVCVADVVAASAVVKTAKLSRRSFELIPSDARERLIRSIEEEETYAAYHQRMRGASPPPLDTTPHFDAPPAHVAQSLLRRESA